MQVIATSTYLYLSFSITASVVICCENRYHSSRGSPGLRGKLCVNIHLCAWLVQSARSPTIYLCVCVFVCEANESSDAAPADERVCAYLPVCVMPVGELVQ